MTALTPLPLPPGLTPELLDLLQAAAAPQQLALVGGAVRDWLLHRVHDDPWLGVPDLDLVVEAAPPAGVSASRPQAAGSALPHQPLSLSAEDRPPAKAARPAPAEAPAQRLVRRLRQRLGPERLPFCQEHGAYGTVELELLLAAGPVLLDVASARREQYPQAAENPQVTYGQLQHDLQRRDFSINAMALVLSADGQLLDPHGGLADLEQRRLRFLHAGSVRDDPTRVLRGARYGARLGFGLDAASLEQLRTTLAAWPWAWRPGDPPGQAPPALGTRLRMELELLLEREPWPQALRLLQAWGGLLLLDPALQADGRWWQRLRWAQRLGQPLLPALLLGAADPLALAERLQVPHRQHRLLVQALRLRQRLAAAAPTDPVGWCSLLEGPGLSPDAVALVLAAGAAPRRPLLRWWLRWRHLRAGTTATELLAAGHRPGPALGDQLRQLRAQRLVQERL